MSWNFVERTIRYFDQASRCTPKALRYLTREMHQNQLTTVPIDVIFETIRGPIHNLQTIRNIFAIPDDNVFFIDLLGEEVLSADELRTRYHAYLTEQPPSTDDRTIAWCMVDVHSHACRALMHISRSSNQPGYTLHALFVAHTELQEGRTPHEILLLALVSFADIRNTELRIQCQPVLPLPTLLCSLLGFMRDKDLPGALVRLPIEEVTTSQDVFKTTCRQIYATMHTQWLALGGDRKTADMQNRAVCSSPCAENKILPNPPIGSPRSPADRPAKRPQVRGPDTTDGSIPV